MILDEIVAKRKIQLEFEKNNISFDEIKKTAFSYNAVPHRFYNALKKENLSVIAEVKKASPSKSVIKADFNPVEIAEAYEKAGADAISCLTEEHYFMGSSRYLENIRKEINLPILRKDFIFDEYQIYEARCIGADAILLISAILDTDTMIKFKNIADSLCLDCLFEIHNEEELKKILPANPEIIGINNRNLKTFEVDLKHTAELSAKIPLDCIKISESGIKDNNDMKSVRSYGADAVLIGETLMRSGNIAETMSHLRENV